MEALRADLDAAHKENVENIAGNSRGKMVYRGLRTPKGKLQSSLTPKSGKKGLQESTSKPRRALGDISNRHRNRQTDDIGTGESLSNKPKAAGKRKASEQLPTPRAVKKVTLSARTAVTPKPKPKRVKSDDVEEIERAYGGLPTRSPVGEYIAQIRKEILSELVNNKTPTILDNYNPTLFFGQREKERRLLESGEPPSARWASPSDDHVTKSSPTKGRHVSMSVLVNELDDFPSIPDDVPPPDEFLDPIADDDDHLLNELLGSDITFAAESSDQEEKSGDDH